LDLAIDMAVTLDLVVECYKLTTGVYVIFSSGRVEIILGRIGLTSLGFIVNPDIIDVDTKQEVKIMTHVKKEVHINAGDEIAHLCFLTSRAKPL
jgi:deoxycytidine triphosphate deaminase